MKLKYNLYRQLIGIVLVVFALVYISIAIILPKTLIPIYEKNIYFNLRLPLDVVQHNISDTDLENDVAYIFVKDNVITSSSNLSKVIKLPTSQILEKINNEYGKFNYRSNTYYYNTKDDGNSYKIAITNNNYIAQMKADILKSLLPVLLVTLLLILLIVAIWSQVLVERIKDLKEKVDNLDNDDYVGKDSYKVDDEIEDLSHAVDKMKENLKKQEEYKNQLYQNISHDFKTPLTVIKSYVEAIEDGVQDEKSGLKIIKQEIKKLDIKVHSLLYLNKLNYIKDNMDNYKGDTINIVDILTESVEKFKFARPELRWEVNITDKKTVFNGTHNMWEAIVDNILSNFMRYAEGEIKITVHNHQIKFYNDGPNIDKTVLNEIFSPYRKGINGQFGLGLSIVKKTVSLLGYEVSVKNEKTGISFIIK